MADNATFLMGYMGYMKFQVVKLFVNQRTASKDDNEFCDLLVRLRNGESTISDWELLCFRNVHHHDITSLLHTPVRLAYTNEVVAKDNYEMLRKKNRTIPTIKALHNNSKLSKLLPDEFGGLETTANLAAGSRVMLVQNEWIDKDWLV